MAAKEFFFLQRNGGLSAQGEIRETIPYRGERPSLKRTWEVRVRRENEEGRRAHRIRANLGHS